jgi:uncharacterized membrane protein YfcA
MPSIQFLPLVVAALTFLVAGFVKGVIGLGLPTVSMGLLSLVMPPAKAAVSCALRAGFGLCSPALSSALWRGQDC